MCAICKRYVHCNAIPSLHQKHRRSVIAERALTSGGHIAVHAEFTGTVTSYKHRNIRSAEANIRKISQKGALRPRSSLSYHIFINLLCLFRDQGNCLGG